MLEPNRLTKAFRLATSIAVKTIHSYPTNKVGPCCCLHFGSNPDEEAVAIVFYSGICYYLTICLLSPGSDQDLSFCGSFCLAANRKWAVRKPFLLLRLDVASAIASFSVK